MALHLQDVKSHVFASLSLANLVNLGMYKWEKAINKEANAVRRKLLKAAVYMPPVILGSMVASPRKVEAIGPWIPPTDPVGTTLNCTLFSGAVVTIVVSSGTNACCPCVPNYAAIGDQVAICNRKRCELSCGTNCAPGVLQQVRCKDFCKTCGFTVTGCRRPCTCDAATGACV